MHDVAILGYGVVGKGVKDIIESDNLTQVKSIFDLESKRDELKDLLETDYQKIIKDEDIDTVFECLGGDKLPYQIIKECLLNSKNVITSNKETVSKHLDEYLSLAKMNNCSFKYEASVGGGIPLLSTIKKIRKYDEINSFKGILNGTSNYILTKIFKDNLSFDLALKQAKEKGFAEADPSSDLNGTDLLRKGIILKYLCFGSLDDEKEVIRHGIENLNDKIVSYIKENNLVLKLVVSSKGNKIYVLPRILKKDDELANVDDEFNKVIIDCKYNSILSFEGKGAGRYPTASAMIQDYINISNDDENTTFRMMIEEIEDYDYLILEGDELKIEHNVDLRKNYQFIGRFEK